LPQGTPFANLNLCHVDRWTARASWDPARGAPWSAQFARRPRRRRVGGANSEASSC